MSRGWSPNLRYSPINGIIVNWGINGEPFSMACMPTPVCHTPSPVAPVCEPCCGDLPVREAIDTYDWLRWSPEIIAGFESASSDMAATYARRAAREFATKAHVLKRQIGLCLQKGVFRYPLEPFVGEDVQGVMRIETATGMCACEAMPSAPINIGKVAVDVRKQELVITPQGFGCCGTHIDGRGPCSILVTVWAAPTEDSCEHDVYLWDEYRREITLGARAAFIDETMAYGSYVTYRGASNFRGDALMFARADKLKAEFEREMRKARVAAHTDNAITVHQPGGVFPGRAIPGLR